MNLETKNYNVVMDVSTMRVIKNSLELQLRDLCNLQAIYGNSEWIEDSIQEIIATQERFSCNWANAICKDVLSEPLGTTSK